MFESHQLVTRVSQTDSKSALPSIESLQYDYTRRKLLSTCCRQLVIPSECQREIKPIFLVIQKFQQDDPDYISLVGLFRLLRDIKLVIPFTALTRIFMKANQFSYQKNPIHLDIVSFHQLMHNLDIQKIYRKAILSTPLHPPTLQGLLFRAYELLERNQLIKAIPEKPLSQQFGMIMKIMAIGQESQQHMMPILQSKSQTAILPAKISPSFVHDKEEYDYSIQQQLKQILEDARAKGMQQAREQNSLVHLKTQENKDKFQPLKMSLIDERASRVPNHLKQFHSKMVSRLKQVKSDDKIIKVCIVIVMGQLSKLIQQ